MGLFCDSATMMAYLKEGGRDQVRGSQLGNPSYCLMVLVEHHLCASEIHHEKKKKKSSQAPSVADIR